MTAGGLATLSESEKGGKSEKVRRKEGKENAYATSSLCRSRVIRAPIIPHERCMSAGSDIPGKTEYEARLRLRPPAVPLCPTITSSSQH